MNLYALYEELLIRLPDFSPEDLLDILWIAEHGEPSVLARLAPGRPAGHRPLPLGVSSSHSDILRLRSAESTGVTGQNSDKLSSTPEKEPRPGNQASAANDDAVPVYTGGASASLTNSQTAPKGQKGGTLPLRVPSARAIPDALNMARALRPLMQRVASRVNFELDEDATVKRIAEQRIWHPVLTPTRSRWLDITLVLDSHGSMEIWHQLSKELRHILEHQGAFRDVRTWALASNTEPPRPPAAGETAATPTLLYADHGHTLPRSAKELVTGDGRRAVIIVSDCLGVAWSDGRMAEFVKILGKSTPLLLIHPLPESYWSQTGLRSARALHVHATRSGSPNTLLRREQPLWRRTPGETLPKDAVPLPVITVDSASLKSWSSMLAGDHRVWLPAVWLRDKPLPARPTAPGHPPSTPPPSPEERIRSFRGHADPAAFHLLCLLASSPLRLPIARVVQYTMVRESTPMHLAEVFLSGLIERITPADSPLEPDYVDFDFAPGVRKCLWGTAWFPDMIEVQSIVSGYLMHHMGQTWDFKAIIDDPESATASSFSTMSPHFAQITVEVLRRLGGKYAEVANRLTGKSDIKKTKENQPFNKGFSGVRVLWVDDYPSNNTKQIEDLEAEGATVVTSLSTDDAFERIQEEEEFDVVISDLGRGDNWFAGFDLLRTLRSKDSIVPYAIYAKRGPEHEEEARQLGAVACTNIFSEVKAALLDALKSKPRRKRTDFPVWHIQAGGNQGSGVMVSVRRRRGDRPTGGTELRMLTAQHVVSTFGSGAGRRFPKQIIATLPGKGHGTPIEIALRIDPELTPDEGSDDFAFLIVSGSELSLQHAKPIRDSLCQPGLTDLHLLGYPFKLQSEFSEESAWGLQNIPGWFFSGFDERGGTGVLRNAYKSSLEPGLSGGGVFAKDKLVGICIGHYPGSDEAIFNPTTRIREWCRNRGFELVEQKGDGKKKASNLGIVLEPQRFIQDPEHRARCCAWSPDGLRFVTGGADGKVSIWDRLSVTQTHALAMHSKGILACAWSSETSEIAIISGNRVLAVFNPDSDNKSVSQWHSTEPIQDIAYGPADSILAVAASGHITVRDRSGDSHRVELPAKQQAIYSCSWSPDGKRQAFGMQNGELAILQGPNGRSSQFLNWHDGAVTSCPWSPNGRLIATSSSDHTLHVCNTADLDNPVKLSGHENSVNECCWAPDSRLLASASDDGTLKVWDTPTGEIVSTLVGHKAPVLSCAWNPDGGSILSCSSDGTINLWDVSSILQQKRTLTERRDERVITVTVCFAGNVPHAARAQQLLNELAAPLAFIRLRRESPELIVRSEAIRIPAGWDANKALAYFRDTFLDSSTDCLFVVTHEALWTEQRRGYFASYRGVGILSTADLLWQWSAWSLAKAMANHIAITVLERESGFEIGRHSSHPDHPIHTTGYHNSERSFDHITGSMRITPQIMAQLAPLSPPGLVSNCKKMLEVALNDFDTSPSSHDHLETRLHQLRNVHTTVGFLIAALQQNPREIADAFLHYFPYSSLEGFEAPGPRVWNDFIHQKAERPLFTSTPANRERADLLHESNIRWQRALATLKDRSQETRSARADYSILRGTWNLFVQEIDHIVVVVVKNLTQLNLEGFLTDLFRFFPKNRKVDAGLQSVRKDGAFIQEQLDQYQRLIGASSQLIGDIVTLGITSEDTLSAYSTFQSLRWSIDTAETLLVPHARMHTQLRRPIQELKSLIDQPVAPQSRVEDRLLRIEMVAWQFQFEALNQIERLMPLIANILGVCVTVLASIGSSSDEVPE